MRYPSPDRHQLIVQEMWTTANNEPLAMAGLQPFGFVDRERYRRVVDGLSIEFVLDCDVHSHIWSYELAILDPEGVPVDEDVVQYWLKLFFGKEAVFASKRSYLLTEARYTFPYKRR